MLEMLIPSDFVRNYVREVGWQFSDIEKAALVHHGCFSPEDEFSALEKLKTELQDEDVIAQIDEYIEREKASLAHLMTSGDDVIFILSHFDETIDEKVCDGYFRKWESAYERGKRLNCKYRIEKHPVLGGAGTNPRRIKGMYNPLLFPESTFEELVIWCDEDEECSIGGAAYSASGKMQHYWSGESEPQTIEDVKKAFDICLFEHAYITLPNPFQAGDIVRILGDNDEDEVNYGVIATTEEEWLRYQERAKELSCLDWFDSGITLEQIYDDGSISHSHIPTTLLEPYQPDVNDPNCELLLATSDLLADRGSLDNFLFYYDRRKKDSQRDRRV